MMTRPGLPGLIKKKRGAVKELYRRGGGSPPLLPQAFFRKRKRVSGSERVSA